MARHEARSGRLEQLARRRRDASLARVGAITKAIGAGTLAAVGAFGVYVAKALPGHATPTRSASGTVTGPPPASSSTPSTSAPTTTAPSSSSPTSSGSGAAPSSAPPSTSPPTTLSPPTTAPVRVQNRAPVTTSLS